MTPGPAGWWTAQGPSSCSSSDAFDAHPATGSTWLPDFMRPYKHYASPVIEAVEAGATASCPADNSTMRRWKKSPTHFACPSSPGADTIGAADEEGG